MRYSSERATFQEDDQADAVLAVDIAQDDTPNLPVALSSDGRWLAKCFSDCVKLWDVKQADKVKKADKSKDEDIEDIEYTIDQGKFLCFYDSSNILRS